MVSQVICIVCSVLPESHTTEITFYKFPKATELPVLFKAWKNALNEILSAERPELLEDAALDETYVCSQHFIASDFAFDNGKLILLKDAIPSRIKKNLYVENVIKDIKSKEYEPTARGNNFASTLTKDFVTTSHHNLRADLICTETSRALTPSVSECVMMQSILELNDKSSKDAGDTLITKKRNADLEQKIESYGKIFKRLCCDNLLTDSYVDKLKEQMPEAKEILNEALKDVDKK